MRLKWVETEVQEENKCTLRVCHRIRRVLAEQFRPRPFVEFRDGGGERKKKHALRIGGEALLVVNQQGEGDETLVEENGNGSGHV